MKQSSGLTTANVLRLTRKSRHANMAGKKLRVDPGGKKKKAVVYQFHGISASGAK